MLLNCLDVFQICELLLTTAPSLCKRIDAAMFDLMSFFGFITFLVSLGMSTFLEKNFEKKMIGRKQTRFVNEQWFSKFQVFL